MHYTLKNCSSKFVTNEGIVDCKNRAEVAVAVPEKINDCAMKCSSMCKQCFAALPSVLDADQLSQMRCIPIDW